MRLKQAAYEEVQVIKILIVALLISVLRIIPASANDVILKTGIDEVIALFEAEDWWGEEQRGQQLKVPRIMLTEITTRWQIASLDMHVPQKKELFYRGVLPLVVHANDMILDRRQRLKLINRELEAGNDIDEDNQAFLEAVAKTLRISKTSPQALIDEALYRLDIIPAGLALGQAAYESGYGSSRFAVQGNALFGQWTFGGEGLVPEQQRQSLGDHRIASYRWPFDSVRAYMINLNSHPAYEPLRKIRAELRAAGKPITSLALADGLSSYSERGDSYVETLKGISRVNKLDLADGAVFRDEQARFLIVTDSVEETNALRIRLAEMRNNGALDQIYQEMRLE